MKDFLVNGELVCFMSKLLITVVWSLKLVWTRSSNTPTIFYYFDHYLVPTPNMSINGNSEQHALNIFYELSKNVIMKNNKQNNFLRPLFLYKWNYSSLHILLILSKYVLFSCTASGTETKINWQSLHEKRKCKVVSNIQRVAVVVAEKKKSTQVQLLILLGSDGLVVLLLYWRNQIANNSPCTHHLALMLHCNATTLHQFGGVCKC